jgi:hypothetical protein
MEERYTGRALGADDRARLSSAMSVTRSSRWTSVALVGGLALLGGLLDHDVRPGDALLAFGGHIGTDPEDQQQAAGAGRAE